MTTPAQESTARGSAVVPNAAAATLETTMLGSFLGADDARGRMGLFLAAGGQTRDGGTGRIAAIMSTMLEGRATPAGDVTPLWRRHRAARPDCCTLRRDVDELEWIRVADGTASGSPGPMVVTRVERPDAAGEPVGDFITDRLRRWSVVQAAAGRPIRTRHTCGPCSR